MEQNQPSCGSVVYDRLPPLSSKYPWLVAQNLEAEEEEETGEQFFYTFNNDPLSCYRCRIPELVGRRIRGCFHGWVILTNYPHNVMWCLWNPLTSNIIRLPPLILEDGDSESIGDCCLSFPPDDPNSVLLFTRTDRSTFVFCRLDRKRKKLRWTEMSYSKRLKKLSNDGRLLYNPTCCNGKVYALNGDSSYARTVIQIDIVVKDREVVIKLLLFGVCPLPGLCKLNRSIDIYYLIGSCTELFCIGFGFNKRSWDTLGCVCLFKLDLTSVNYEIMEGLKDLDFTRTTYKQLEANEAEERKYLDMSCEMWEEMLDLKDAIFFVDVDLDYVFYSPAIASELGGYIHIRSVSGEMIHSYDVKDKTISLSSIPSPVLPTTHLFVWECNRLEDDHVEGNRMVDFKQVKDEIIVRKSVADFEVGSNESSYLLNLPFDMLEMIMKLSLGVDYMNFRATCKRCRAAAPETPITRLQTYSAWLMVLDIDRRIITLTNPMLCDKYFIKNLPVWIRRNDWICCFNYGWLLLYKINENDAKVLGFYNPFTCEIRELPDTDSDYTVGILCFSAPLTSPDCMVVGFTATNVYIHFVAREPSWRKLRLDFGHDALFSCYYRTFHGRDIYFLTEVGQLYVYKDRGEYYSLETGASPARTLSKYFLMNCDQNLMLVIVANLGESVEVFKLNDSSNEWETIDGLGSHMIYISGRTCICIEAKSREMENKIYFSRFDSEKERMVFYSLETRMNHTFNGKNIDKTFQDFKGTCDREVYPNAWIEPTWS